MAAGRRHFQRALGSLLPLDLGKVGQWLVENGDRFDYDPEKFA